MSDHTGSASCIRAGP